MVSCTSTLAIGYGRYEEAVKLRKHTSGKKSTRNREMANEYSMRISRLTVDKLGVKLYDKVSAVIAELISNSYDADAQEVVVHAPMGKFLAVKEKDGSLSDKNFKIEIGDNGTGMTPEQMQQFFLVIGADRRADSRRGSTSPKYGRKVMGRKGVGKLAPFGICKIIEVISAGGEEISKPENGKKKRGYLTSHIILNYDEIIAEDDEPNEPYKPSTGQFDDTLSDETGTTVILRNFNYRLVSDIETLSRQIAQRFGIPSRDWKIILQDNTKSPSDPDSSRTISEFDVQTMPNTRISFQQDEVIGPDGDVICDLEAGFNYNENFYPIKGWVAYSKEPYKDDLMAGIRIYCRGKIAAQTLVFNRAAGFTGEHTIRSYLVGELQADWLDEDEDLIQTDRRDILWSDELGSAFQKWGQEIVRRIGTLARDPIRKATLDLFFETGHVEERVLDTYPSNDEREIREQAIDVAKMFGRTMSRSEVADQEVVDDLVDLSIALAPHVTLDEKMRDAAKQTETPFEMLSSLLRTARIAELSSFGRIAEERLKVIGRLETLKDDANIKEDSFQNLIEDAPWLINPEWAPITANQSLNSLRKEFEKYYERETGEPLTLSDFQSKNKRPDFVLSSQEGVAQIVEIKKPGHALKNEEMDRIVNYHDLMGKFLSDDKNSQFRKFFNDFHITLVCDESALTGAQRAAYDGYLVSQKLTHISWKDFLLRTQMVHKDFLTEANRQRGLVSTTESH